MRSGTSGWNSSANSSAKKTPSRKWETSPTKYVAAVGAAVRGKAEDELAVGYRPVQLGQPEAAEPDAEDRGELGRDGPCQQRATDRVAGYPGAPAGERIVSRNAGNEGGRTSSAAYCTHAKPPGFTTVI